MKKVAILGSTGSIGTQTLDVIRKNNDKLKVCSLVAFSNKEKLIEQSKEFLPEYTGLISENMSCLLEAVKNCDAVVVATRGIAAIEAVLYCLKNGIDVCLANKETLVCGGKLVTDLVDNNLFPVDSEHAAIKQCIGENSESVKQILLTASGGPFYEMSKDELKLVDYKKALKHPNWSMGKKITIDSATMMNKSLEVLEASRLFNVPTSKIKIVVHRQSVVHSMVQFNDNSVVAQLAKPDMRLPILQALLGYGNSAVVESLNFDDMLNLTFEPCDFDKFPCAKLGYEIDKLHPLCATVMNACNDVCVESFLKSKIAFNDFYSIICSTIEKFEKQCNDFELSVGNIMKFDESSRNYTKKLIDNRILL